MQFPYVYGQNISSEYPNVAVSIERITPSVARGMMAANVKNRQMKQEPIKKAIMDGEWRLNGASIVFSEDGTLLDGQNRLKACIDANMPIDTIVIRGITHQAQMTMDVGAKRVLSDWIKMSGYPNSVPAGSICAVLQRVDIYGLGAAFYMPNGSEVTLASQIAFFEKNYEGRIKPLIPVARQLANRYKHVGTGAWAALVEAFMENADREDVDFFIKQLLGLALPCQSVLTLQKKLDANAASRTGYLPVKTVAAFVIKTFNAYMRGEDVTCLKYAQGGAHPEAFPTVYKSDWKEGE